jgi:succinyl-diaminopimelate desuccinylase
MDDNTIDTYLQDFVRETSDIVKIKTYRRGDLEEKTVQANIQKIQDYLKKSAREFNETQTNLKLNDFSWSKDPYALDGFKLGTGAQRFWLISHLDTVPPAGDDWGPFDPKVEDREYRGKKTSFLKGRGALDDKGPAILAFNVLKAVAKHFDNEPARLKDITIEVLFDTSEETDMSMPHYFETLKDDEKPFFGIVFDGVWSIRAEKGVERPSFTIQRGVEKLKGIWIDSLTAGQNGSVNQIPSTAVATIKGDAEALSRFGETIEKAYKEFGFDDPSYKRAELQVSRNIDQVDLTTLVSGAQHGSAPDENRENGANPLVSLANFLAHVVDTGELAENAVGGMCQFIAWGWGTRVFGESHPELLERYDEVFQKENGTTYALTFFETTTSAVTLALDIRYALGHHSEPWIGDEGLLPGTSVFSKIFEALVKRFNDQNQGLAVTVQTKMAYAPDVRNPNNPNMVKVLRAYKKVTGQASDLVAVGGGTDAKGHPELLAVGPLFLDRLGPPVNYHGINEGAPIDDLETSAKILYRLIVDEVVPPVPRKS